MDRLITRGAMVGRLTVIDRCYKEYLACGTIYRWLWKCQCMCGRYVVRSADWLKKSIGINCGRCNIPVTVEEDMVTDYQKERLIRLKERMVIDFMSADGDCCTRVLFGEKYLIEALEIVGREDVVSIYTKFINGGAD